MVRGFILQPSYRTEAGRPVVTLYGRLETGESFLIRDTRRAPRFYLLRSDEPRARALGARIVGDRRELVDFAGNPVVRVEVDLPSDVPPLRERLRAAGIACFEADVRFAYRQLIDHGIRGGLEIRGVARRGEAVDALFENPEIAPGDWTPSLRVLSIDIETDPTARRLLSVALEGCGASEVLLLTPPGRSCPATATPCADQRELLRALIRRVAELDPDVLTGWIVVDFDLTVLARMARRAGLALALGRGRESLHLRPTVAGRTSTRATLPGRLVLDGIELLRGAFVRLERYSLDGAAREILGRGKTIHGSDRASEIEQAFETDRERFVEYNRNDARLVLAILDKLRLVELCVERSRLTGMPPDRVGASIASFDFLYLSELWKRGVVAPSVRSDATARVATRGGHVLEPAPGLYRNVLVFDFRSLYPSLIRTFQIDPLGRLPDPAADDDAIVAPNGAAFRRGRGILPGLLDALMPLRAAARARGDAVTSQAIKILMNSFYGVLGTSACRFASPELANAITGFGKEILLWTKRRLERAGHRVIYGDTDSLFLPAELEDAEAARALGRRLAGELNRDLAEHVRRTWRVDNRLELEFERLYLRLLLPAARGRTSGARKRYAGLIRVGDRDEVVFTGMEVVRRDWTELARRVQRELYERLFSDRPVDGYLRDLVRMLRAGRLDDLLVYRKTLRKQLDAYTAVTPPHVAAARKLTGVRRRRIAYVFTRNGPEPVEQLRSPIDHEHYVQRQVRPVSEPVLTLLGLDFARVVGDASQPKLF